MVVLPVPLVIDERDREVVVEGSGPFCVFVVALYVEAGKVYTIYMARWVGLLLRERA